MPPTVKIIIKVNLKNVSYKIKTETLPQLKYSQQQRDEVEYNYFYIM